MTRSGPSRTIVPNNPLGVGVAMNESGKAADRLGADDAVMI
jgi:hypothetical protein